MHHYQRHIGDYRKDTPHLSLAQHGAYSQLLDWYYASEKPLPDDMDMLCRICGAVKAAERQAVDFVLRQFFTHEREAWLHKRCDREIEIYQSRSRAGKMGADVKWTPNTNGKTDGKSHGKLDGKTNSTRDSNQRVRANHEPVTNNQEPTESTHTHARGAPVSLDEAVKYAALYAQSGGEMIRPDSLAVQKWYDHRAAPGWVIIRNGVEIPLVDWQADLRQWLRSDSNAQASRSSFPSMSQKAVAEKKEGGAVEREVALPVLDVEPERYAEAWAALYAFPAPPWVDCPKSNRDDVLRWLATNPKKEGGAV